MPTLVLSRRQCDLAIEAFKCLRTGRLEGDPPMEGDARELAAMASYLEGLLATEAADTAALPRRPPSPGRDVE